MASQSTQRSSQRAVAGSSSQSTQQRTGRQAGTQNFSEEDRMNLLEIIEEMMPTGAMMWDAVAEM
jgi:hypothetical protein